MCAEKWLNIVEKLVVVGEKMLLSPSTIGGHIKKASIPRKPLKTSSLYTNDPREEERIKTSRKLCTHQKLKNRT
jgi:hypothetical protein